MESGKEVNNSEGREVNNDEGWTYVSSNRGDIRNGDKWDAECSKRRSAEPIFFTFFLTSFADKVRAKDLYEALKNLGDIHEFIIPSKRNKRGNKYGVVRFFNVRDERMMEARDNFFIEGRKRFSNLPSFIGRNLGRRFGKLK
ncbi:unnamed protein product [Lathyrus oleraceus]